MILITSVLMQPLHRRDVLKLGAFGLGAVAIPCAFPGTAKADFMPPPGNISGAIYGPRYNQAGGWHKIFDSKNDYGWKPFGSASNAEQVLFADVYVLEGDRKIVEKSVRASLIKHYNEKRVPGISQNVLENQVKELSTKILLYSALDGRNPTNFELEGFCSQDGRSGASNITLRDEDYLSFMVQKLNGDVNPLPIIGSEKFEGYLFGNDGRLNKFFNKTLKQVTDNGSAIPTQDEIFNVADKNPTSPAKSKSTLPLGKKPPMGMVDTLMLLLMRDLSYDSTSGKLTSNHTGKPISTTAKPVGPGLNISDQVEEAINNQFELRKMRGVNGEIVSAKDFFRWFAYFATKSAYLNSHKDVVIDAFRLRALTNAAIDNGLDLLGNKAGQDGFNYRGIPILEPNLIPGEINDPFHNVLFNIFENVPKWQEILQHGNHYGLWLKQIRMNNDIVIANLTARQGMSCSNTTPIEHCCPLKPPCKPDIKLCPPVGCCEPCKEPKPGTGISTDTALPPRNFLGVEVVNETGPALPFLPTSP